MDTIFKLSSLLWEILSAPLCLLFTRLSCCRKYSYLCYFEIYIYADHCNSTELDSAEKYVLYLFRSSFFCILFILTK